MPPAAARGASASLTFLEDTTRLRRRAGEAPALPKLMIQVPAESLNQRLVQRIQSEGAITFAEWMRAALYEPGDGYYSRHDLTRWGRAGDYRTSAERSALFSATFARYFARLYHEMGQPPAWTILEAGSGGGHFAHGVLQSLNNHFPEVFAATHYVIDEASASAQVRCREMTREYQDRVEFGPAGVVSVDPGVIFSNELLDAFPVHRVTIRQGELEEFFVDLDDDGKFAWVLKSPSTDRLQQYLSLCEIELGEGQIADINLEVEDWFRKVAGSLKNGYVVSVDYGASARDLHARAPGEARYSGTLRGFRDHALVEDVLSNPGAQDLTATVNWTFVEKIGQQLQLEVVDFKPQDKFLLDEGLLGQLELENQGAADSEKLRLSTAAREMILPNGMAASFQVMVQRKVIN